MSTDIITNDVPDYLRAAYESSSIANLVGGGPAIDRISFRGRVWRQIVGGKEVGTNPAISMDFVIIAAAAHVSRSFYAGQYDPSKSEAPTCWSSDGNAPDGDVADKQSHACANCPRNVEGSGTNGKGRACRFAQRIAVALPGELDHVYAMSIPATSIWGDKVTPGAPAPLRDYAQRLASLRVPMEGVTTRFSFDINATQPTIRFQAVGYLSEQQVMAVLETAKSPETALAIQNNVIVKEVAALAPPVTQPVVNAPASVQTAQATPVAFAPVAQTTISAPVTQAGFGAPAQAEPVQQAATGFAAQPAAEPAKRTRRSKEQIAADEAATKGQATGGFGVNPNASPSAFAAAAVAEPTVVSAGATQAAPANLDIQSLIDSWDD